jgi:putative hemolysin
VQETHNSAKLPVELGSLFPNNKFYSPVVNGALQRMLSLDRLAGIYNDAIAVNDGRPFFEKLLSVLNVNPQITMPDLARIPRTGPVVVVANHPFGFIEGCILAALLRKLRPDAKIMANSVLSIFPEANDCLIHVNPFGGDEAKRSNQKGLKQAVTLLRDGGMLAVFPAGEVAHVDLWKRAIVDPEWSSTIARIVRITGASVLPLYFAGANGPMFQLLGMIHPRVRTALLPHEFFNKQDRDFELRIGSLIPEKKLRATSNDTEMIEYLRRRTYVLQHRDSSKNRSPKLFFPLKSPRPVWDSVIAPVEPERLEVEVASLADNRKLAEMGDCAAFYARAHEIPNVLREIGRLREITFRDSGEGTGKSIDLDAFDAHYVHLFIWNRQARELVGAYRLGATDTIIERFGKRGLYTSTLFSFHNRFLDRIGTALEVGRSFVRAEYQKTYAPLLLLWRGIGAYVAQNPQYKILFGPVSISNDYQPMSRQLMVTFFKEQNHLEELARLVRARSPFRKKHLKQWDYEEGSMRLWDIEDLAALVADIETDSKGLPVLLRQYLKLGGKLLGFNVDRNFADALDGLIMVDLTRTDSRMLERYLGKEGSANFLAYHQEQAISA